MTERRDSHVFLCVLVLLEGGGVLEEGLLVGIHLRSPEHDGVAASAILHGAAEINTH